MRRILSIDGGGIRGAFFAAFLAKLEEDLPHPIGSYFDLITGTSTGGLIALALGMGISAQDILALYESRSGEIFSLPIYGNLRAAQHKLHSTLRWIVKPKYNNSGLRQVINDTLGLRRMSEAKTRLLIPAWRASTSSVHIFRTPHARHTAPDQDPLAAEVALATASAPTYFDRHVSSDGHVFTDGAIWAHNPVALAVAEAIGHLEWQPSKLHILSLGFDDEARHLLKDAGLHGLGLRGRHMIKLLMEGQSKSALESARTLIRCHDDEQRLIRITQGRTDKTYALDNIKAVAELSQLGRTQAHSYRNVIQMTFLTTPITMFEK